VVPPPSVEHANGSGQMGKCRLAKAMWSHSRTRKDACAQGEWSYSGRREERATGSRVVEASRVRGPCWKLGLRPRLPTFTQ
jgi:hypothetical protein